MVSDDEANSSEEEEIEEVIEFLGLKLGFLGLKLGLLVLTLGFISVLILVVKNSCKQIVENSSCKQ